MVIWLWFKVENICDISILMYNLLHCWLEWFYSPVVKNPNSLFTMFTCLFWGQNESSFAVGLWSQSQSMSHISLVEKNQGPHIWFCFVFVIRRQFLFLHHCYRCNRFLNFLNGSSLTWRPNGTLKCKAL